MGRTPVGFVRSNDPQGPAAVGGAHEGSSGGGTAECFNLADFGADPTGAIDVAGALQGAVDAVADTDSRTGTICVPPGSYTWRNPVDISSVGALEIVGPRTRSKNAAFYDPGARFISDVTGLTMFLLSSCGPGQWPMLTLRQLSLGFTGYPRFGGDPLAPGDCKIIGYDIDNGCRHDVLCVDCEFFAPPGFYNPDDPDVPSPATSPVIELGSNQQAVFHRCSIEGGTGGINVTGFGIEMDRLDVVQCLFQFCDYGVRIVDTDAGGVVSLLIAHNKFGKFGSGSPAGSPQIVVGATSLGVANGRLIGNEFFDAYPIKLENFYGNWVIANNVSDRGHHTDPAIYFDGGAEGRALIASNYLQTTGDPGASEPGIVIAGGDYNKVTGNLVFGYDYGASVLAGATNTNVSGNTLHGLSGDLLDAGTGTYVNGNQS